MEGYEYISKANQQLTDETFYKIINEDPTRKHSDIVNNSKDKKELLSTETATKTYYKQRQNIIFNQKYIKKSIPGRPAVNLVEYHTAKFRILTTALNHR